MPSATALSLQPEKATGLVFGTSVRTDWRLLEVDDDLLQEILDHGWVKAPLRSRSCIEHSAITVYVLGTYGP